jgi:hypothetical protein
MKVACLERDAEWKMQLLHKNLDHGECGAPELSTKKNSTASSSSVIQSHGWNGNSSERRAFRDQQLIVPLQKCRSLISECLNTSNSKRENYKAQQLLGPGEYESRGLYSHNNNGKISEAKPKSDID